MATSGIKPHYVIEDAIEHLYDVSIFGKTILTTVTKYPQAVAKWIKDVRNDENTPRHIGLDVELFPDVNRKPHIGTLQLCVPGRCLVIQLFRTLYPTALDRFLSDNKYTFVGINVEAKLDLLIDQFPVDCEVKFKDLGELAADLYQRPGLAYARPGALVSFALGMAVEKPRWETDWGRWGNLSDAQVQCACVDAFVAFELGRWLIRDDK